MTAAFVLDCSVALSWLFEDEVTTASSAILERLESEIALVPPLWYLELVNSLVVGERRGRISADQSDEFIRLLSELEFEADMEPAQAAIRRVLPLCRKHQLSSYDAAYLELAERRKLPLATLDEPLRKAAKKVGVKLLGK